MIRILIAILLLAVDARASQASVQSPGLPAEVRAKILAAKAQKNSAERTRQRAAKLKAALVHAGGGAPQTPFDVAELCTIIAAYGSDQEPVDWSIRDVVQALDGQLYIAQYTSDSGRPIHTVLLNNCGINKWDGFDVVRHSVGIDSTWVAALGLDVRDNQLSCVPMAVAKTAILHQLLITGNPLTIAEASGLSLAWEECEKESFFLRSANERCTFDPPPGAPFTISIVMPPCSVTTAPATTAVKPELTVGNRDDIPTCVIL